MNMAHLRESNTGEQPNSDFNDSVCCLVYFCKIIIFKSEILVIESGVYVFPQKSGGEI